MKLLIPFTRSYAEIKRQAREDAAQEKPLSPTIDFVFKTLFSCKDDDSREALRLLLSSCIHRQVKDLRLQNTEMLPAFFLGKMYRLDVHVTFNDGEQADVEMQVKRSNDDLKARSLLYASRLLESQLGRGERFKDTKRVYVIFFLDLILFPQSAKVPRRYVVMEETEHDRLNELLEVIYYEMPKTADAVKKFFEGKENLKTLPTEQKWCIYFKYRKEEGMEPLIDKLRQEEEGIMRADRALKKIERDQDKRAHAIFWDNQRLVYNSDIDAAKEEGLLQGRMTRQEEIARNMIAKGYKFEEIQAITGLSSEEIDRLR